MAQVDRHIILQRGVLGSSSLCGGSFVAVLTFFPFLSEVVEKFEVFPPTGEGVFNTNKTLLKEENYTPLNSPQLKYVVEREPRGNSLGKAI